VVEHDATDESLAAEMVHGDVAAFAELYDRYVQRLHVWAVHTLGHAEAEDALQEVFLRAWQKAAQFEPARGRFRSWLMAIARHEFGHRLRRGDPVRRRAAAERIEDVLALSPDPADELTVRERDRAMIRAICALPAEQRRVLVLGYFGGMSQSAMARELDLPLGTVKKRVRLAMQKLRTALCDESTDAPRLRVIADP
jgi:RNA polymerase sigma-70 factor (ECF subfamily)